MEINFFNENFDMTPVEYAVALFKNTSKGNLTLARRNDNIYDESYDEQFFESYTMDWEAEDVFDVVDDFEMLISELKDALGEFDADDVIGSSGLIFESDMVACRAKRWCLLFKMGAPEAVINREECLLMDAMIIARFATGLDYTLHFADWFRAA